MLRLIAGPDGFDTRCQPLTLGDPSTVSLQGLKVYDCRFAMGGSWLLNSRSRDQLSAHQQVVDVLEAQGCDVEASALAVPFDLVDPNHNL